MFFIYGKGNLTLKRGSKDVHGLKIGGNYYTFYNSELNLLKTLVEENCNAESKNKILKNKGYKKVNDFYVNRNGNIIALKGNNGEVFDMREKGAVNWVIKRFVETIEDKKGDKMGTKYINYPQNPYNNPQTYIPNQSYMDPNYQRLTQQQLNPGLGLNPRLNRRVTGSTLQQPDQKLTNNTREPKYYYLNLGEAELVLEQGYPIENYLEIKEVIIKDKIHETGKEAKARVVDIFHRYIDELEREEKEIDALVNFINSILPKDEKVELLLSTENGLNAVIQYEDNEGIQTIKVKSFGSNLAFFNGMETVVYTKPKEPMVFKTNSYYFKEKIIKELSKLVEEHNRKIENSKEF